MPIKAVVFDIGNVLIRWDPDQVYREHLSPAELARFHSETRMHDVNAVIDNGANWADTIEDAAQRMPEWAEMIRLWHSEWHRMAAPAIDPSVRMLRTLRSSGTPVFALSNFGVETFAFARTVYDFLDEFDLAVISGHEKTIKPEPRIYEILEQRSGLRGETLLFADDLPQNIAAAQARGWQTHLFDGPDGFAARLMDEGLLPKDTQ